MTDLEIMRRAARMAAKSQCWIGMGCVIARNGEPLIESYNRTQKGEKYCQEFRDLHKKKKHDIHCGCDNEGCDRKKLGLSGGRDLRIVCSIHAETDAIAQAARKGISLNGSSMFVTSFPCLICLRSIIATGIKRIVYMNDFYQPRHLGMLEENGVKIEQIKENEVWS